MGGQSMETEFVIDERIYPLEAVQSAAYAFTDRAFIAIEPAGDGRLKVVMSPKPAAPAPDNLKGEFDNELVHQALRLRVSEANRKIREFIVTKALVSAQPAPAACDGDAPSAPAETCPDCAADAGAAQGEPAPARIDEALEKEIDRLLAEIESGDGAADPLGVAVPWEEKFGSKAKPAAGPKATPAKAAKPKPAPKAKAGAKAKGR
jgi:His-Xaa-Ser system protein HxsD